MFVLALESSTSSAKAMVYDSERGIVRERQEAYGPALRSGGKSRPEDVYGLLLRVGYLAAAGYDIGAVALCGIWQSLCVCDDAFRPVTPVYAWDFLETASFCENIRKDEKLTNELYRRTGCMVNCIYPRFVLPFLRKEGVELKGKKFLTQGGYNFFRLTGEVLETACTQSGAGFINLDSGQYDDFVMDFCGVRAEQFGPLATYEDVRPLSGAAAGFMHIPAGIPVVPSFADGALNQIGSYADRAGVMTVSVGTSAALRMTSDNPSLPPDRRIWCYRGVQNNYIKGGAISGACNCINWLKDTMLGGRFSFDELEEETGSPLPEFLPFLYGERCPGWNDRQSAVFAGIRSYHKPQDFYHAIQLGIVFNLYQCYLDIAGNVGSPEDIIVSGGITRSVNWCRMLAGTLKKKIRISKNPSASTIGAAVLALHAAGSPGDISGFKMEFENAEILEPDIREEEKYEAEYRAYLERYEIESRRFFAEDIEQDRESDVGDDADDV